MDEAERSIFQRYYEAPPFVDRFEKDSTLAVDVIIPIIHTNEFWRVNLLSIYREVPVKRLLIGDGGCVDNSLEIAREFPRVEILDHRSYKSLGYSIRGLIEAVRTEWFIYLHSDVFLPPDWFETMNGHRKEYDWFECDQRITVLADYLLELPGLQRAFSGSQMGRKAAFEKVTPLIDDDFLYRNEDIIFATLLTRAGFRYGKASDTFHFHQVMHKPSRWSRKLKRVTVELQLGRDEEIRANDTYVRGIIKYLRPKETAPDVLTTLRAPILRLSEMGASTVADFEKWTRETNPEWLPYLGPVPTRRDWIADRLISLANVYRANGAWQTVKRVFRRVGNGLATRS